MCGGREVENVRMSMPHEADRPIPFTPFATHYLPITMRRNNKPSRDEPVESPASTTDEWYDGDLSPERFRALGYRIVDMMSDYLDDIREVPVFPGRTSAAVAQDFDEPLPETGQAPERILEDWTEKVLPNTTHLGSPRYFGFVNGSGSMMGILAEALAASVNMNAGARKPGPAACGDAPNCVSPSVPIAPPLPTSTPSSKSCRTWGVGSTARRKPLNANRARQRTDGDGNHGTRFQRTW